MPSLWPLGPGSAAGRDGGGLPDPPCQRGIRLGSWAPGLRLRAWVSGVGTSGGRLAGSPGSGMCALPGGLAAWHQVPAGTAGEQKASGPRAK